MSRKLGKRAAAAAAAAEAAMVATVVRLEQQEQGRLVFFRRSLERNDFEIAALQDLHATIQITKRHLLRSCHDDDDDGVSPRDYYYYYHHHPDDNDDDCLLLLDLGQGKIRLTADKEGLEDAAAADASNINNNNNSKSLVSKLSPQAYHWSYDFLLRLQLRRQLLNRLMRRLQRMAVLMDAMAATSTADNNNNNSNKGDNNNAAAVAMAALVQPPLPPKYGDLRLYMDAREIQEFQQHWERQERARIQIELQRESFHAKQAHEIQELDKSLLLPPTTAAAAVTAVYNPALNPNQTTSSSSSINGDGPPVEAAEGATDDTAAVKQEATDDMDVDDKVPTKETEDNAGAPMEEDVESVKKTSSTTATINTSKNVDDQAEEPKAAVDTADAQEAAKDTTPMMAESSSADNVDEKPSTEKEQEPKKSDDNSNNTKEQPQHGDDDEANVLSDAADDDLEIDYEAYREYMNAYEKIIHPTTGQVQYTLSADDDDDAQPFAAASSPSANKTGKNINKKKKHMPDFSTFTLPGIGATTHRTMSTQEKEAEYERWSTALLARIPQQPTMAELGLEHQVFFAKQRRRRANQRRQELEEKHKAAAAAAAKEATTTTTAAVTLPFLSPGKKLRNKPVDEQNDTKMTDDEDKDAPATAPPSVSAGKTLRNKQDKKDDDSKMDDDSKESDRDDDDDDDNRMDVDVADNEDKEKEVKDGTKDFAGVDDDVKDKQESEDEQEKDISSDEEEQSDEDNEESQETKADEEKEDPDSSPSKKAATSDEKKPPTEEKQDEDDDDDDDDKPPTNQKKRPIILAPTPSFYEQDLKRIRGVHAEIMRSSMADHARRKIKDATQEYNSALQVSSELYARQKQLHAQLHAFTADTRTEVAKMQNQYEVDLAVAKSQWNRRRIEFERKKLDRLMPERNNPNYRPDGTPMTKMYETQQDPVRQIVSSTVAHIVDTVDLIDTCRLQNDQFTEEFRPPPPNVDSALTKNRQVDAVIRQEISNLGVQLRNSEEDRQRSWKRMLKTKAEFSGLFGPNSPIMEGGPAIHPHYQQHQQHHHHPPSTPLPNLHQSSSQSFPQEAVLASHNLPSFAPARAPRHPPVRRPSTAPSIAAPDAAAAAGSDSKYSAARVRERIANDGTVAPVTLPKKNKDGLFQRPAGRTRKGMEWDAVRGIWVPAEQQTTLVQQLPPDNMMMWRQHPPQG